jgi:hypothetical protein
MDEVGIGKVYEVSTHILEGCPVCNSLPARVDLDNMENIAPRVNHMLEMHGLRLLHVGQQTGTAANGEPFVATVAVLGEPRST